MAKKLLALLKKHDDFRIQEGEEQSMIFFQEKKVGGYNNNKHHWYLSRVFVADKISDAELSSYSFEKRPKKDSSHWWWQAEGLKPEEDFKHVLTQMTSAEL
ncbi:hypothetical protein N9T57_02595 [Paracoccaceae bacterium]|nr:hypothetical protein [Paracoccaceae bacterium]